MTLAQTWRLRARTLEATARLLVAMAVVRFVPFGSWSGNAATAAYGKERTSPREGGEIAEAMRLARHVERAASRLPIETKCLPRGLALSGMLRRRAIAHRLCIAVRPAGSRGGADDLHA